MESELYVKQAFHSKKFYNPNVSPFLRKASARQQRPLTATTSPKADGLFSTNSGHFAAVQGLTMSVIDSSSQSQRSPDCALPTLKVIWLMQARKCAY